MTIEGRDREPWLVRATYVFIDGAPTIDELDQRVGGRVRHLGGGIRHAIGCDAWRTMLEWGFGSLAEAREAVLALQSIAAIDDVHVEPTEDTRTLHRDGYRVTRTDALAGKARCPHCRSRSPGDLETEESLQGVAPGESALLRCRSCGLPMAWEILPEGGGAAGPR